MMSVKFFLCTTLCFVIVKWKVKEIIKAVIEFIKKIETNYSSGKGGAVSLGFKNATGDFVGFVDADGASKILRLAKPTIYSKVCRGEIPAHKVGRRLLFKVSDLRGIIKNKN